MKTLFSYCKYFLLTAILATAICANVTAATNTQKQFSRSVGTGTLYTMTAESAHLSKHPDKKGWYVFTVSNVSPEVTYFQDQPAHKAGRIPFNAFANSRWPNSNTHSTHNPNVSVVYYHSQQNKFKQDVLELTNPQRTGKNSMQFDAHPVIGFPLTTGDFENVVIFIDKLVICPPWQDDCR